MTMQCYILLDVLLCLYESYCVLLLLSTLFRCSFALVAKVASLDNGDVVGGLINAISCSGYELSPTYKLP